MCRRVIADDIVVAIFTAMLLEINERPESLIRDSGMVSGFNRCCVGHLKEVRYVGVNPLRLYTHIGDSSGIEPI